MTWYTLPVKPNLTKYKAILFDMDGTLIDTRDVWGPACAKYITMMGKTPSPDLDIQRDQIYTKAANAKSKMGVWHEFFRLLNEAYGIEGTPEAAVQIAHRELAPGLLTEVAYLGGAAEFLNKMKDSGKTLGLVTASGRDGVHVFSHKNRHIQDAADFRIIFGENIVTSEDVAHSKPAPDGYLLMAKRLGVKPSECLVFEDSLWGVQSAVAAGMDVCAVNMHLREGEAPGERAKILKLTPYHVDTFCAML